MKSGFRTSEFFLTVISLVGVFVPTVMGLLKPDLVVVVVGIVVGLYSVSRGVAKLTRTKVDDEIVEAIERHIMSRIKVE